MATEVHNLQELRRSASLATKVFIQRDYSDGTICQFQTKFPPELDSRIERQLFEETVKTLNSFYAEAEKIGGSSYLEGCLACATAYFIFLCMETHYEKVLKKISRYIQEQNEKVFAPRGLLLTDPVERGMRVVSFLAVPFEAKGRGYVKPQGLQKLLVPPSGGILHCTPRSELPGSEHLSGWETSHDPQTSSCSYLQELFCDFQRGAGQRWSPVGGDSPYG
ncbi:hypothetical protein JEQ12_011562 [Ovis aries]|uniref:Golgin subfamily A member 7/ERF4 domain-containing protein n=1 Tax=Ovis aries TaxID=9940 RepID=A0A836CUF8_SHEEP|nr:hypothetical protein JEQ12_011562 [Ovis aries]